MLSADQIAFLSTPAGRVILTEASSVEAGLVAAIQRLRKSHSVWETSAAIELLELRSRAEAKFSRASEMYFTREGLEQSTGEAIARWRASFFPIGGTILDLCCGIGG